MVHDAVFGGFVQEARAQLAAFAQSWTVENSFSEANPYEFSPLINPRAGERFQWALRQTVEEGGELVGGERLEAERYPGAHYYRPALGIFRAPVALLTEEIFGPYFAVVAYVGGDRGRVATSTEAECEAGERLLRIRRRLGKGPSGERTKQASL